MKITTVGIDLAKNVFQVHGIDERGKAILGKQLRRAQVAVFFANLPPCVIGMEACASAHHWARTLQGFGHTVRLIAAQFVKPYVKTNKMMPPMPKQSVRRWVGRTCASCPKSSRMRAMNSRCRFAT
jgi:transposase